jgi:hypothetical protein
MRHKDTREQARNREGGLGGCARRGGGGGWEGGEDIRKEYLGCMTYEMLTRTESLSMFTCFHVSREDSRAVNVVSFNYTTQYKVMHLHPQWQIQTFLTY